MLSLPSITLLVIDSRHPELAFEAINRTLKHAEFARVVLVTRPRWRPLVSTNICIEYTDKIADVNAYSKYVLSQAVTHVRTDYALIAQWDSFILNPGAWDESFLHYDYIGAPWLDRNSTPVGNGGFSLRSRRLMHLVSEGALAHTHPEDLCICVQHRGELESKHGARFAPIELARRFSFELQPVVGCFGFHGLFNFHHAMSETDLLAWLRVAPTSVLHSPAARALAKGCIRTGYFEAAKIILKLRIHGNVPERLDAIKLGIRLAIAEAKYKRKSRLDAKIPQ